MKRELRKFLAVAALICASTAAWALEKNGDVYQIGSADDLQAFAELVNSGEYGASAVLTADITALDNQSPIGLSQNGAYTGNFDGQNHTIVLNWTGANALTTDPAGLFPWLAGNISNLRLDGIIECTNARTGALAGRVIAGVTISGVVSNVTMKCSFGGDSALSGLVSRPSANDIVISNCMFTGQLLNETGWNAGGLIGWGANKSTLENCAMLGTIKVQPCGSNNVVTNLIGRANAGNIVCNNVYYMNREENENVEAILADATEVTLEQVKSGELAYLLNGSQSQMPAWFQTIGTDEFPVLDNTHKVVYLNGHQHCDRTAYEDSEFSNDNVGLVIDEHDMQHGFCTYCKTPDINYLTPAEDGWFELADAYQVNWFATMVNNDIIRFANARLTAPIDFEGIEQISIGTPSCPFGGIFDGQLFPITNVNGMFFGTVDGGNVNGIAIESGEITASGDNAHTGSVIGHSPNSATVLTNSYSKAYMNGGNGDLGGISGKFVGTMKNVYFAGKFSNALGTWSVGGLAGSSNSDNTSHFENCFVIAEVEDGWDVGYGARGALVGWLHTGNDAINSYAIVATEGTTNFSKIYGDGYSGRSSGDDCWKTDEEFASGAVAWALNNKTFVDAPFFQTLGEDPYPVLDNTHGLVYATVDGYASATADNFDEMRQALIEEANNYAKEVIAYSETVKIFQEAIGMLNDAPDRDSFIEAYTALSELRKMVEESEKAYAAYIAAAEDLTAKMEESGLAGNWMDILQDYLKGGETEPCEEMPNGSYLYIINNMQLDNDQIAAEIVFMNTIFDNAIREGYKAGDNITNLLTNPTFADGFNGWEYTKSGSTFTTGGVKDVMPTAESWNATFNMYQILTDLSDGVYEVQVNAAYRTAGDIYNQNYSAWAYANGNETLVMTEGEDAMTRDKAVDLVNCYINGGNLTNEEDGSHISPYDYPYYFSAEEEDYGYVPYGPLSCSYAFNAGRYVNTIVAYVTDGQLSVGLRLPGSGLESDWMGFSNFQLFYQGSLESETAAAAFDRTLAGDVARANTLLAYRGDTGSPAALPAYPATLNQALQAAIAAVDAAKTGEEKLALVEQFTALFQEIYEAKKAYVSMINTVLATQAMASSMAESDPKVAEMLADFNNAIEEIAMKWEDGAYSVEECENLTDLRNTALYEYLLGAAPEMVNGFYQLKNVTDLKWFAQQVGMGNTDLKAELAAPIDLAETEWEPIGTTDVPFAGTFNGHLFPLTNLNGMLFGTTNGATINGVAIESGEVTDNKGNAHTGSVVGVAWKTTITNSYSNAAMNGGDGDLGGLVGKHTGTMRNCYFAGSFSSALGTWSMGGLMGSSDGGNSLTVEDCFSFAEWGQGMDPAYGARGALIGWCHENCVPRNSYAIADALGGSGFTKLVGDGHSSSLSALGSEFWGSIEDFTSGRIAYIMNDAAGENVWFQTLGTDRHAFLDANHLIVAVDENGNFYNKPAESVEVLSATETESVNVYDMSGRLLRSGVNAKTGLEGLPRGLYIVGGKKTVK